MQDEKFTTACMNMFYAPIRPDLSLSTDPQHCDVLELDMDARTVRLRISGMQVPTLTYADWCEPIYGLEHFSYNLFGPLVGSDNGRGKQSQSHLRRCPAGRSGLPAPAPRASNEPLIGSKFSPEGPLRRAFSSITLRPIVSAA